jgi:hypothetical protein
MVSVAESQRLLNDSVVTDVDALGVRTICAVEAHSSRRNNSTRELKHSVAAEDAQGVPAFLVRCLIV